MRVWTIQPVTVWEQLQQHTALRVDEGRLPYDGHIPPQYRWLAAQLMRRLPDYSGNLPWWAYCNKPDLRCYRHHRPAGRHVRLELAPSPGTFMSFPCWAWDTVYAANYLAFDRQEHDVWMHEMRRAVPDEDEWPLPEPWKAQLEASWERLFDPALPYQTWDNDGWFNDSGCREAVLEIISLRDVRAVTLFWGRQAEFRGRNIS